MLSRRSPPVRSTVGESVPGRGPGTRLRMQALAYTSYNAAATIWAFVASLLIVLAVGWYVRRRRR